MTKKKNDWDNQATAPDTPPKPRTGCLRRIVNYIAVAFLFICGISLIVPKLPAAPKPTATPTITPGGPTLTPTPTFTPTITLTTTNTPADTPTFTLTFTPLPTDTPQPPTVAPLVAVPIVATAAPQLAPTATVVILFTPEPNLAADLPPTTYYVKNLANVRSCPQRSCDAVVQLSAGASVIADGVVNGDIVNPGNAIWYRVQYNGQPAYVYSDLVSSTPPSSGAGTTSTGNNSSSPVQQSNASPVIGASEKCAGFDWGVCSNYTTPANCEAVRAAGIPSHIAACCFPARDGDKDGEACYDD